MHNSRGSELLLSGGIFVVSVVVVVVVVVVVSVLAVVVRDDDGGEGGGALLVAMCSTWTTSCDYSRVVYARSASPLSSFLLLCPPIPIVKRKLRAWDQE